MSAGSSRTAGAADPPSAAAAADRDGGPVMFDAIAPRYDFLNRLLSAGLDRGWRRRAVRALEIRPGDLLLDLCAGTGDFGLAALRAGDRMQGPPVRALGLDVAGAMLRLGMDKVTRRGLRDRFTLGLGDAEELPLADASIDGAMIAFGIRNVADPARALRELARVIRPGRRLVILEFSLPSNRLVRAGYLAYFRQVLPRVGRLLSGHRRAYAYLPESVARFPAPGEFCILCREAGFADATATPLTLGIVNLYVAIR
jgi:demethylmenaquinone methyltransferase/2-methoxy-6-polyprenyl-1,4-benzoquinol methylase